MIVVERASISDAARFADLEQAPDTKGFILPDTEAAHARNITNSQFVYLRIVKAGSLLGFMILVLDPDENSVELRRIVVAAKNRGVGHAALVAMERLCRDELLRTRIWLDVFEINARARHLYEKLGYRQYGECCHDGKTLLLYEKLID